MPSSEPTVEIAYMRPAISPESSTVRIFSRIAHGDTEPSISTGTATSTSTPNSEPANAPTEYWSNASTLSDRNGSATNGTSAISTDGDEHRRAQRRQVRPPVRHPPAEPVADRERHQHDRDRVRPHDRRRAEERRHQPRGGDLRAQRRDADREDEQLERRPCALVVGREVGLAGRRRRGRTSRWGCHRRRCPGGIPPSGSPSAGSSMNPQRLADPLLHCFRGPGPLRYPHDDVEVDRPAPGEELNPGRPTEPRQAATVILLRGGAERSRCCSCSATPAARFMGGAWVFPGGARRRPEDDARTAAACARSPRRPASRCPTRARWSSSRAGSRPPEVRIRFDTHFFLAAAPDDAEPRPDGGETVDARAGTRPPRRSPPSGAASSSSCSRPSRRSSSSPASPAPTSCWTWADGRTVEPIEPQVVMRGRGRARRAAGEPGYRD